MVMEFCNIRFNEYFTETKPDIVQDHDPALHLRTSSNFQGQVYFSNPRTEGETRLSNLMEQAEKPRFCTQLNKKRAFETKSRASRELLKLELFRIRLHHPLPSACGRCWLAL